MNLWKRNLALRIIMLREHCPSWSVSKVLEVTGWHKNTWRRYRNGEASNLSTIARLSWIVGLSSGALLSKDASKVVSAPLPDWTWLDDYEDRLRIAKSGKQDEAWDFWSYAGGRTGFVPLGASNNGND